MNSHAANPSLFTAPGRPPREISAPGDTDTLIKVEHLTVRRDERLILDDINLRVDRGEFIAITGPNGGGKTTLLRVILGLLHPSRGRVWVQKDLSIGYLPQKNMIDSHFPISVREVVESGLLSSGIRDKAERQTRADEMLAAVGMEALASRPIGTLSGGQLQRTLLGRAIISNPQLLVLDEPLSYIDKRFEGQLYDLISRLASTTTILLVSHELSGIVHLATRILTINKVIISKCGSHPDEEPHTEGTELTEAIRLQYFI